MKRNSNKKGKNKKMMIEIMVKTHVVKEKKVDNPTGEKK